MPKISYIKFTEEQKERADRVDLERFLLRQGEKLLASGYEKRLARDRSVTVCANQWYDHAVKEGGGPVSFLQTFYGMSYPEAVTTLLDGEQGMPFEPVRKKQQREKKGFVLPAASRDMRRMYAYLLKSRLLERDAVSAFVRAGLLYESEEYHNAVFVGKDENGVPRHAHMRSLNTAGRTFRINVEGSDPRCSFHHIGTSGRLYVFEAPIDLLSFVTLYPKDWQSHSYVALCGTAEHAMLWMLERAPVEKVLLCLDHDKAGIEAAGRLSDILRERGVTAWPRLPPQKDWNEAVKARHGLPAQPSAEHPQLLAAGPVCGRVLARSGEIGTGRVVQQIPILLDGCVSDLRWHCPEKAAERMETAAALALAVVRREYRQMGEALSERELSQMLWERLQPHRTRGGLEKRAAALPGLFQETLREDAARGVRTAAEKKALAERWLDLAASCAVISIKHEAEQSQQPEEKFVMKMG